MNPHDYLNVATRAYTATKDKRNPKRSRAPKPIKDILIFDTETTTDVTQALNFGCYRHYRVAEDGRLVLLEEGLFYGDDLPERSPEGLRVLQDYVTTHRANIDPESFKSHNPKWTLSLRSRKEFVDHVFYPLAYHARATVVLFNAPFDLSRIAANVSEARGRYHGGFSLQLTDNTWKPRLAYKAIDSKRQFISFKRPSRNDQIGKAKPSYDKQPFDGSFIDLHQLVFALTDQSLSLEKACEAFGINKTKAAHGGHGSITTEYVDYCRQDVELTGDLFQAVMAELKLHPIDLDPTKIYSPATLSKAYFQAMGVVPVLDRQPDFDLPVLGKSMAAFGGGRAETRIRRTPLPGMLLDVTSMYPSVDILLDLWGLLTADRIEAIEATSDVQQMLDDITLDHCFKPETWRDFVGLAEMYPNDDVLPVRSQFRDDNPSWNLSVNRLTSSRESFTFSIPDLVASKIRTGKSPQICRAWKFRPVGKAKGLRKVMLRGMVELDPYRNDPFKTIVEERQRFKRLADETGDPEAARMRDFLKVLANAGSYGIFVQMVSKEGPVAVAVYGSGVPFECQTQKPEIPGDYCFPPIATAITGAAKLILMMLECLVTEAGGKWIFCDTDSMAIVADDDGGLYPCEGGAYRLPDGRPAVRALSFDEVDQIRRKFNELNPYDPEKVRDLLREDGRGWCFSISAKRYAFFACDDIEQIVFGGSFDPSSVEIEVAKHMAHGLGHLYNPKNKTWIRDLWEWILRTELSLPAPRPDWFDLPAVTRTTISTADVRSHFKRFNRGKPYTEQIKPANFILSAYVDDLPGHVDSKMRPIAAFNQDSNQWLDLDWINQHDPDSGPYRLTTNREWHRAYRHPGEVAVKTIGRVVTEYRFHPESKFLGPDGEPCKPTTKGILDRRHVYCGVRLDIGKESNRLEDAEQLLIDDLDQVLNVYRDPEHGLRSLILPMLGALSSREVARATRLSHVAILKIRDGATPHARTLKGLEQLAVSVASNTLTKVGVAVPKSGLTAIAMALSIGEPESFGAG